MTSLPFVAADPVVPAGVAPLPLDGSLPLASLSTSTAESPMAFGTLVDQALGIPTSPPDSGTQVASGICAEREGAEAFALHDAAEEPTASEDAPFVNKAHSEEESTSATPADGQLPSRSRRAAALSGGHPPARRAGEMAANPAAPSTSNEVSLSSPGSASENPLTAESPERADAAQGLPDVPMLSRPLIMATTLDLGAGAAACVVPPPLPGVHPVSHEAGASPADAKAVGHDANSASVPSSQTVRPPALGSSPPVPRTDVRSSGDGASVLVSEQSLESGGGSPPVQPIAKDPAVSHVPPRHVPGPDVPHATQEGPRGSGATSRMSRAAVPSLQEDPIIARETPQVVHDDAPMRVLPMPTRASAGTNQAPNDVEKASEVGASSENKSPLPIGELRSEAKTARGLDVGSIPDTGAEEAPTSEAEGTDLFASGAGSRPNDVAPWTRESERGENRLGRTATEVSSGVTTEDNDAHDSAALQNVSGELRTTLSSPLPSVLAPRGATGNAAAPETLEEVAEGEALSTVPLAAPADRPLTRAERSKVVDRTGGEESRNPVSSDSDEASTDIAPDQIEFMTRRQLPVDVPGGERTSSRRPDGIQEASSSRSKRANGGVERGTLAFRGSVTAASGVSSLYPRSSRELVVQGETRGVHDVNVSSTAAMATGAIPRPSGIDVEFAADTSRNRWSTRLSATDTEVPIQVPERGAEEARPTIRSNGSEPVRESGESLADAEHPNREATSAPAGTIPSGPTLTNSFTRNPDQQIFMREGTREESAPAVGGQVDSAPSTEAPLQRVRSMELREASTAARGSQAVPVKVSSEAARAVDTPASKGLQDIASQPVPAERPMDRFEASKHVSVEPGKVEAVVAREGRMAEAMPGGGTAERLVRQVEASERYWVGQMRGGTPIAEVGEAMRKERKTTKAAEVGANFLPADRKSSSAREAGVATSEIPVGRPTVASGVTPERIADLLLEDLMSFPYRVARTEESPWVDRLGASSSAATAERIGRLESLIAREVVAIRQLGAHSLSVLLRPDSETQLMVQLQQNQGTVEAAVKCDRGDLKDLQAHWPMLREALAEQNIRLLPLQAASSSGGDSHSQGSAGRQFQSEEKAFRQGAAGGDGRPPGQGEESRHRSEESLLTTARSSSGAASGGARVRGARRDGWEFWA